MGNFAGGQQQQMQAPPPQLMQIIQALMQQQGGSGRAASFNQIPTGDATSSITPGLPDFFRQLETALMLRNTATGRAFDPHGLLAAQPLPPQRGDGGHEPMGATSIHGLLSRQARQPFGTPEFIGYYDAFGRDAQPQQRQLLVDALKRAGQTQFGDELPDPFANLLRGLGGVTAPKMGAPMGVGGGAPSAPAPLTSFMNRPNLLSMPANGLFR